MLLKNRRGLFITSVVRKLFERIRLEKISDKLCDGISEYQCGGVKNRSTSDHVLTLNAVVDYNRFLNTSTYVFFGDAVKCFDKLS